MHDLEGEVHGLTVVKQSLTACSGAVISGVVRWIVYLDCSAVTVAIVWLAVNTLQYDQTCAVWDFYQSWLQLVLYLRRQLYTFSANNLVLDVVFCSY